MDRKSDGKPWLEMDKFQGIQDWNRHAMGGQYFLYLLGPFLFFQYQTAKHPAEKKPNIYLNQLHTQPNILGSILKVDIYGRQHAMVHRSRREFLQGIYTHGRAMDSCLMLQPGRAVSFILQTVSLCHFFTKKVLSIAPCLFFICQCHIQGRYEKGMNNRHHMMMG